MTQPNKPVSQRAEEPNWLNAETCIENMQIAYEDALEADPFDDGNVIPIDTMVDASDLGVLIGLARYAVANRLASTPMSQHDRELRRKTEEAFDLVAPFVAKFAAAVDHYNRTPPRYKGSQFNCDPDPSYQPALGVSVHGGAPIDGPTIGDLRMLAAAYEQAISLRQLASKEGRHHG